MSNHSMRALQRAKQRPDTPAAVRERITRREVMAQAIMERTARFPVLTAENAAEAIAWQEARYQALLRAEVEV